MERFSVRLACSQSCGTLVVHEAGSPASVRSRGAGWSLLFGLLLACGLLLSTGCQKAAEKDETAEKEPELPAVISAAGGIPVRTRVEEWPGKWLFVITEKQAKPDGRGMDIIDYRVCLIEISKGSATPAQPSTAAEQKPAEPESAEPVSAEPRAAESGDAATAATDSATAPPKPAENWDFKQIEVTEVIKGIQLHSLVIDDKQITLGFQAEKGPAKYVGKLLGGVVIGGFEYAGGGLAPARLIPTAADSFNGQPPIGPASPTDMAKELMEIGTKKDESPSRVFWKFALSFPTLPVAIDALMGMCSTLLLDPEIQKASEEDFRKLAAGMIQVADLWGDRIRVRVQSQLGSQLAMSGKHIDLAMELLKEAEDKLLPEEQTIGDRIRQAREIATIGRALERLKGEDADLKTEAVASLEEILTTQPHHPIVLNALADHYRVAGNLDRSRELYGLIVALPTLEQIVLSSRAGEPAGEPGPRDHLTELWKLSHVGDVSGLDAYLDQVYREQLAGVAARVDAKLTGDPPAADRPQALLVESFTNVFCMPCVATDLALQLSDQAFRDRPYYRLEYHQHSAGPDWFTNPDAEERMAYYQAAGTPLVYMNGRSLPPVIAGPFTQTGFVYDLIRRGVGGFFIREREVEIRLEASLVEGNLAVAAQVDNLPEADRSALRLRLALVELHRPEKSPNGLRDQHMIVREMLGGAKGTSVKSGELRYERTVAIADIRDRLQDYLDRYEEGAGQKLLAKPLDFGPLAIVAWVQNDKTKEVLQSTMVRLDGQPVPGAAASGATSPAGPAAPAATDPAAAAPTTEPAATSEPSNPAPAEPAAPAESTPEQ